MKKGNQAHTKVLDIQTYSKETSNFRGDHRITKGMTRRMDTIQRRGMPNEYETREKMKMKDIVDGK